MTTAFLLFSLCLEQETSQKFPCLPGAALASAAEQKCRQTSADLGALCENASSALRFGKGLSFIYPEVPEILSEFLLASMMLLCGSKWEIMLLEKLLVAPEWVPGNSVGLLQRRAQKRSSHTCYILEAKEGFLVPGRESGCHHVAADSQVWSSGELQAGPAHCSGWRMAWPSMSRTSVRNYDLLWTDRQVLYRHPLPSPKTPGIH